MSDVQKSAGIVFIHENKLLLCHSTNSKWFGSYMPPKGHIEDGETEEHAAIRETFEEIGIKSDPRKIGKKHTIKYFRGKNIFKEVFIFEYRIKSLQEIGLESEIIPKSQLQIEEIDDARFMNKEEATIRIFHRYAGLLELID
jgi:8-oxo-dGTP pyrophosphatase MutT (NUDIX family)